MRTEIRLKNRLNNEFHRHLRNPITYGRDTQRTKISVSFGYQDPTNGLGSVLLLLQITGQFQEKRLYPYSAFYGLETQPIYSWASSVGTDKSPGMTEDVSPNNFVVECVEAAGRFLLGLDIQLPL
jgi:hypothetical protein